MPRPALSAALTVLAAAGVVSLIYATRPASAARATAAHPYAASLLSETDRFVVTGSVREQLDAGPYRYFRLETSEGDRWVVALGATSPTSAQHVRAWIVGQTDDFHSPRLARRFETLLFGVVRDVGGAPQEE